MSYERWQNLLSQLELIDSSLGQEIWTEAELQSFEAEQGIVLPDEYREFCQTFGTGQFGDYMRIFCPHTKLSEVFLNAFRYSITNSLELRNKIDYDSFFALIDAAFMFGNSSNSDMVFWDLRTYKQSDKSYDICLINIDCFNGRVFQLGRSFYDFVQNFCLEVKSQEVLPEAIRPSQDSLFPTFTRADSAWITNNYPGIFDYMSELFYQENPQEDTLS